MPAELFKIIAIYLLTLVTLSGLAKLALSFWHKPISFIYTLKRLIIAALVGNLISFIIFETTKTPGYYWGEMPIKQYIILGVVLLTPVFCILISLIFVLKKQLMLAKRQSIEARGN